MENSIQMIHRAVMGEFSARFGLETANTVRAFHRSFPEYSPTPLAQLKELADRLGVAKLYVKDESKRFGLNAFKVLGGSWCIGRYIAKKLSIQLKELTCERLTSPETRSALAGLTFVTATDGNHGRRIAWTAARLGLNSVVYMPKGSARERLENIRALGAKAEITPWNYLDVSRAFSQVMVYFPSKPSAQAACLAVSSLARRSPPVARLAQVYSFS